MKDGIYVGGFKNNNLHGSGSFTWGSTVCNIECCNGQLVVTPRLCLQIVMNLLIVLAKSMMIFN
jgi:hypothetical protein